MTDESGDWLVDGSDGGKCAKKSRVLLSGISLTVFGVSLNRT